METAFWKHETAIVDDGAKIGKGTKVWHFSHVCGKNVEIGEDCSFGQNTYVGPNVKIGKGVRVQNNVSIYDFVELGDYVFCGPAMVFTNVINPRAHIPRKDEYKKTIVRRGVSFGANCTVICGIEIGEFAFVAAGAVVSKDVKPFAMMKGIPAKRSGWICHCGRMVPAILGNHTCSACESLYVINENELIAVELKRCFSTP